MFIRLFVLGALFGPCAALAHEPPAPTYETTRHTVAFYHLGYLFDAADDATPADDAFTPTGTHAWTADRYGAHLQRLGEVIARMGDNNGPEVLALTGLESRRVVEDLLQTAPLRDQSYAVLYPPQQALAGQQMALLYKSGTMLVPAVGTLSLADSSQTAGPELLIARAYPVWDDSVFFMVTQWNPHPATGQVAYSEAQRTAAAHRLRSTIDSLKARNPAQKIVLMGHFGEAPDGPLLTGVLEADDVVLLSGVVGQLYNPTKILQRYGQGSTVREGRPYLPDQIMMTGSVVRNQTSVRYQQASVRLLTDTDMQTDGGRPLAPLMDGAYYAQGASDHFPVCIRLEVRQEAPARRMISNVPTTD